MTTQTIKEWSASFKLLGKEQWISAPTKEELNTKIFGAAYAPGRYAVTYYVEYDVNDSEEK